MAPFHPPLTFRKRKLSAVTEPLDWMDLVEGPLSGMAVKVSDACRPSHPSQLQLHYQH